VLVVPGCKDTTEKIHCFGPKPGRGGSSDAGPTGLGEPQVWLLRATKAPLYESGNSWELLFKSELLT